MFNPTANISEEERQHIEGLAKVGAKKICQGKCTAGFVCGHEGKAPVAANMPLFGKETTCPLAQYNIGPDTDPRPWYERKAEEMEPSDEEMFALCAMCEHSDVTATGDEYLLTRTSLEHFCVDCPVKTIEDNIAEARAEAAMS